MVSSYRERRAASWGGTTRSTIEHRVLKQESPKLEVTGGGGGVLQGTQGMNRNWTRHYTSQNKVR